MSGSQSRHRAALRSEAAHWYNQRLAGDMTLDDERHFEDWLARSDAHRDAYRSIDRAWLVAGKTLNDLALSNEPDPAPRRLWTRWRGMALAASLMLAIGLSWGPLSNGPVEAPDRAEQIFLTEIGQRTTITLPDDTILTLDSETEMRFADLHDERRVDLIRGRAFFQVATDHSRPFVVYADGKRVRAVGTAFEVSIDQGEVAVVLAEGKVRVEEAAGTGGGTDMSPGRQLIISPDRRWTLSNVDVQKETSWTEGRLVFMHDSIAKAVADVNRYSKRKVTFAEAIPDKRIMGVFSAGDVDGFVKALELNGIAKPVSNAGDQILLSAIE